MRHRPSLGSSALTLNFDTQKGICQLLASLILRLLFFYLANSAGVNWDICEAASTLMHFIDISTAFQQNHRAK